MVKRNILVGISLFFFFAFTTAVFSAGLVAKELADQKRVSSLTDPHTNVAGSVSDGSGEISTLLTTESVAQHATPQDCWIIISDNVYDVTTFVSQHPGGASYITKYCGKEAGQAFESRDQNPPQSHSPLARNLLRNYYIGPLGKIPTQLTLPAVNGQNPVVLPLTNTQTTAKNSAQSGMVVDTSEVARHTILADCWMVISGKVYNITAFVAAHPGGQSSLSPYCGKDATAAFQTKGGGSGNHSSFAYNLLTNYLVANLGSTVALGTTVGTTAPVITLPPAVPIPTTTTPPASNLTLTAYEVATHNSMQNCWLIISANVYDVTSYIPAHPGGASALVGTCGTDATNAFQTKGGRGSNHNSTTYNSVLPNYRIGALGSSVSVNPTPTTTTPPTSTGGSTGLPNAITVKYPGATKKSGSYEDNGSWKGKITTTSGQCREIKVNSSGTISEDKSC